MDEAPAIEADNPIAAADAANEEELCPITGKPINANDNESIDPPTDRTLLRKNMGEPPGEGYHAHHLLPWKFKDFFAQAGLDVNDPEYGLWVKAERHLGFTYKYNTEWTVFFIGNENPSKTDILNKLLQLNNTGLYK